jgi:hypothetical protein
MKRPIVVLASILALVMLAGPASATSSDDWDADGSGDTAVATGTGHSAHDGNGPSNDPVFQVPVPYKIYRYTPYCSANDTPHGNDPNVSVGGADALCGSATMTCPKAGDLRFWVSTMQMHADGTSAGEWHNLPGSVCRGADDPAEGGPVQITEAMIFDAAKQAAPKPVVHVEPKNKSYVNVPTNVYADTASTTTTVQVLGQPIQIKFTPSDFSWSFGDGDHATGAGVRAAKVGAPGAVEHTYLRSGNYHVTLSRKYDVVFTLPGGKTLTLPTPLSNTSDPYPLTIGEIQSVVTKVG